MLTVDGEEWMTMRKENFLRGYMVNLPSLLATLWTEIIVIASGFAATS